MSYISTKPYLAASVNRQNTSHPLFLLVWWSIVDTTIVFAVTHFYLNPETFFYASEQSQIYKGNIPPFLHSCLLLPEGVNTDLTNLRYFNYIVIPHVY